MKSIKILDCTLRDGGFVNDWNFGYNVMNSIYKRLDIAGIDIIELGFLNDTRKFDENRSIMPTTGDFGKIFNIENHHAMIVGMIILGECRIENVGPKSESILDGIRVVFKKENIDRAYEFAKTIKQKGYTLFLQAASFTDYSHKEAEAMIKKMNELKPSAFSIVDTYGLMHKKELLGYFDVFDKYVSKDTSIGYHAHNNYQQAYTNAIELINHCGQHRELVIDSTVYGMGKGTGNANTELMAKYLNRNYGTKYEIGQILEIIDLEILSLFHQYGWGYSLDGFLCASNDCHPTYVKNLRDKKVLSVSSICEILSKIPDDKRTTYHKDIIEELFIDFQNSNVNDDESYANLKTKIKDRNILILSPGSSIVTQEKEIKSYIEKNNPLIFTINSVPKNYRADYVFCSNARRYNQLMYDISKSGTPLIITANVTSIYSNAKKVFNFSKLRINVADISDNATLLLIKIFNNLNVKEVFTAGFDGFDKTKPNYSNDYNALCEIKDADAHNKKIIDFLKNENRIKLNFITESKYNI